MKSFDIDQYEFVEIKYLNMKIYSLENFVIRKS